MTSYHGFPRITCDPAGADGRPCIRDLGLTVAQYLRLLAQDARGEQARRAHPGLEAEDHVQALQFAAQCREAPPALARTMARDPRLGCLAKLAQHLAHLAPGPLAELRRGQSDPQRSPAFLRLCHTLNLAAADRPAWACIVSGMARLKHLKAPSAGSALIKAGLAPARLQRLLDADAGHIAAELRAVVAFLAGKGQRCSWYDLAGLVLSVDPKDPHHQAIRRKVAGDFYKKSKKTSSSNTP
jgi:uncharacterized protein (DUF433 family)